MSVTVTYLGLLAELAGKSSETFGDTASLFDLRASVVIKYPGFKDLSFVSALNGTIVHTDMEIKKGDHVILVPPPPGG
jgi:molybdopterin converting factor small subunit